MALQSEFEKEAERLEKFSNIKRRKEMTANETESVAPSIVTMPNQEELKALLEANDLLKAKVFKQQSAITSILSRSSHKPVSRIIEDATVRLYNKKEFKRPTTFQNAENLIKRDPPRELKDCHYLINGLRDVLELKDREILGLKLNQQEIEKKVGLEPPMKFKEEMNKLKEDNKVLKAKAAELEREVKLLEKIKKNQGDALVGANKSNQQPHIDALEKELAHVKHEKRVLKELFDKAIKDQIALHD